MDLRKLKQFLEIADAGSLSGAAKRLNVAQPALSQAVQSLEGELGVMLFERHARGVSLTEFGTLLAERANAILREVDGAKALIRERVTNPSGRVRLAIPSLLAGGLAMPLLAKVLQRLPDIGLVIVERDAALAMQALHSAQVEIALTYGAEVDLNIALRPVVVEELVVGVPPSSPLAGRRVAMSELENCQFALLPKGDPVRTIIEEAATRHGVRLTVAAELGGLADLVAGIDNGLATIAPPYALARAVKAGSVKLAVLKEPRLPCCLFLMTSRHNSISRPASAVHELVLQTIEELVRGDVWSGRYVGHMPSSASMISIFTNQA
jgi:DNA-binding transcriptional LysR family regulator